jgi:rRNA biogenesis protein RRP5
MSVVGVIKSINDLDILVSLPNQTYGTLSITDISSIITEKVQSFQLSLEKDDEDNDQDDMDHDQENEVNYKTAYSSTSTVFLKKIVIQSTLDSFPSFPS